MRQIKFRAWDKNSKKFITVELTNGRYDLMVSPPSYYDLEPWQQYTGLKDRNGTEIYEGDILIDDDTGEIDYARVEWFEGGWSAHPWFATQEFFTEAENYEVVGNIYEDPELLKEITK